MSIDVFGFDGGWFHGFFATGCVAAGFAMTGLVAVGFEELGPVAMGSAAVGFKQHQVIVPMPLKPPVSPRPQSTMMPNPM